MSYPNYKSYNQYIKCCKPIGAQGAQGVQGAQGAQGAQGETGSSVQSLQFTVALEQSGVSQSFIIAGVDYIVASSQTTTLYNTPFAAYNNHIFIDISSVIRGISVNNIDIVIKGTSISESSAVPDPSGTETISIPPSISIPNGFQTLKKWLYISDISFSNVSSINYDIKNLGYIDFLNTDVRIIGYRAEILGDDNSDGADITFIMNKVDNGATVFTKIIDLENITINNPIRQIVDHLRTGIYDRSYTMPNSTSLWPANTDFVLKQTDFNTYFTSNENVILGTIDEGIIIKVESTDLGAPNGPQYISLIIYYERI